MRVLWFANTPCNADEYFNTELKGSGGWLKALDQELQKHVDLHIAFYSKKNVENFKYKNTNYYPIYIKDSLLKKIYDYLFNRIVFKEHINIYLKIVEQVKPDIIHIHGTENPFGYIINNTKIPVVISIQGNITICYHKYLVGIEKKYLYVTDFKFKNPLGIFKNYNEGYKIFRKMMLREREILSKCNHIIGRTDWDYYITRVLAPHSRYYHVDEILRNSFYENAGKWRTHNRDKLIIVSVTGPAFYKGLETVCQTLYELQGIGLEVEWGIVGINSNDLIVKVVKKKLGNKYPIKGLTYLGLLNEKEIIEQLLNADIYVMPSHIENSPNNLCEAMMIGMPCISSFVGGIGSLIKDRESGLLIQNGDPWSLTGAIIELFYSKETTVYYCENAIKETLNRHDRIKIIDNLLSAYKCIVEGKKIN